jgi:hypothetical protein
MTDPRISIWAYPWDLWDIGLDAALDRAAAAGAGCLSVAASYHAGRFLQPGNPRRRVCFPEDGTVYHQPDPARWADREIAPKAAALVAERGDVFAALVERREAGGPRLSCWTVCLHNLRLGMAHPGHVLRTCFGDPALYGLCPSSPAVVDYVAGMAAELSERYRPDRIELESPDFMVWDHGFHHEKDGLGLTPEDRLLLSLCFCEHCRRGAEADGAPFEAARRVAAEHLAAAFARETPAPRFPGFPDEGLAVFNPEPALAAFLRWRARPISALVARVRDAVGPATEVLVIDEGRPDWAGVDRAALAAACDGLIGCIYQTPAPEVAPAMAALREAVGPDRRLVAGFWLFHPSVADGDDLAARAEAAAPFADGLNVYNLGLVPPARMAWAAQAAAAAAPGMRAPVAGSNR